MHPSCCTRAPIIQNPCVKKENSLDKLKGIAWGRSGDNRVRARPENRDGWLSVESQVRQWLMPLWPRLSSSTAVLLLLLLLRFLFSLLPQVLFLCPRIVLSLCLAIDVVFRVVHPSVDILKMDDRRESGRQTERKRWDLHQGDSCRQLLDRFDSGSYRFVSDGQLFALIGRYTLYPLPAATWFVCRSSTESPRVW